MSKASVSLRVSAAALTLLAAVGVGTSVRAEDASGDTLPITRLELAPSTSVNVPSDNPAASPSPLSDGVSRLDLSPPPGLAPELPPEAPPVDIGGAPAPAHDSELTPEGVGAAPTPLASPDAVPASVARPDPTPLASPEVTGKPETAPMADFGGAAGSGTSRAFSPTPETAPTPGLVEPVIAPGANPPLDTSRAIPPMPETVPAPAVAAPAVIPGASPPLDTSNVAPPAPEAAPVAAAPTAAEILGQEIHGALDRLVAAKSPGHPIGAGDWSGARKAIAAVYAERAYAPLWLDGERLGAHARSALARLARADEDGLELHEAVTASDDLAGSSPTRLAEVDVAISAAVVAYALQASGARLNPRALSKDVTAHAEVADPAFVLKRVSGAENAASTLADFNPPQAGYRLLRDALARLRGQAPKTARFAPGPVLTLGMADPRVPLIRARFRLGDLGDPSRSDVYDVKVASAVAAFQRIHGLKASGALTEATSAALDGAVGDPQRARLILANMEMWRWQPREMGETRVEVNVPDFSLKLMNGEDIVHRARVIVGKPDTPTPIFSNSIKYMLFNPVWHVPESIIKKEMAPRLASDPDYLARRGFKVTYVGDRIEVEQPPGEANALGRMLFLFPNEHAVYLHDTPSRSLFSASFRALSHGCVRVEDPARLAEILMGGAARGWTEARVHSLLGDKERTVSLPAPVPIHLEYFTEFVDESGTLRERDDLYGLTGRVASALANAR